MTQKIAIPVWRDRIAPVFDTAPWIQFFMLEEKNIQQVAEKAVDGLLPLQKAQLLVESDVNVLICGAISKPLFFYIAGQGIQIVPHITGSVFEVINTFCTYGSMPSAFHLMPGCRGKGPGGFCWGRSIPTLQEENFMFGKRAQGEKSENGQPPSMGGGLGKGRMQGPKGAGPAGFCVCPSCGYREPHERGIPCNKKQCPNCGTFMTRE